MRSRPSLALAAAALLACAAPPACARAFAAMPDTERARALADYADRLEAFGYSGQLLVAEHGVPLLERAYGFADRERGVRMTVETRLAAGSVTKSFVAAAVLKLAARGALALDDPLERRWPGVPADKRRITIEQLLTHRAGFAFHVPDGLDESSRDGVVGAILAAPLEHAPGERFAYSNAGFDVLAGIVERASGRPFDAFLRDELLGPAGMDRSGIGGARTLPKGPGAAGYDDAGKRSDWREWPYGWSGTGSGRLVTTAHDLWRWAEALRGGALLGAEGWAKLTAPHPTGHDGTNYGLGLWLHGSGDDDRRIVIGGEVEGYRALCRIEPAAERVIVVLVNVEYPGLGRERFVIADALAAIAEGREPEGAPPAPRVAGASERRAIAGAWTLETGGRIDVSESAGALVAGARGGDAIALLEGAGADDRARREEAESAAFALVRDVAAQDTAAARARLSEREFAIGFTLLTARLRVLLDQHGDLGEVETLGATEAPELGARGLRVWMRLGFARRRVPMTFDFDGDRLAGWSDADERPFPRRATLAAVEGGGFAAYDFARSRATTFALEREPDGESALVISSGDLRAVAHRSR